MGNGQERTIGTDHYSKVYSHVPYGSAEAWAEWRRTGYPNLLPAVNYNHDVSNILRNEKGADIKGYRRYPLPQTEHAVNSANVAKAIADDLKEMIARIRMFGGRENNSSSTD